MSWQSRIAIDPNVMTGKPVVRGTRITVDFVLEILSQGWSEAQVLQQYPGLTREDVLACLAYAASVLRNERIYPLPA